jgi:hypothetical protein
MAAATAEARRREVRHCGTCKADREVVSIEKVSDGNQIILACNHTFVDRIMMITENLDITEGELIWTTDKDPEAEIRKAIEYNDYSKIVIIACSAFEKYGKEILIWHLKENPNKTVIIALDSKNNKNLLRLNHETALNKNKLKDLHVVIDALALSEIITDDDATKMHCIRQLRNNFLHRGSLFKLSSRIVEKVNAFNDDIIYYVGYMKDKYDKLAASPSL